MAVLSADSAAVSAKRGICRSQKLVSGVADTYYKGAFTSSLAAGKITPVPADNLPFAGIVDEQTVAASGDRVPVIVEGEVLIAYTGAAVTDEGEILYLDCSAASDNPADLVLVGAAATGDMAIGRIIEFVSSTAGSWVRLHQTRPVKVS